MSLQDKYSKKVFKCFGTNLYSTGKFQKKVEISHCTSHQDLNYCSTMQEMFIVHIHMVCFVGSDLHS